MSGPADEGDRPEARRSAVEDLARADPPPVELNPDQQARVNEAAVRLAEIKAEQAKDDRELRKEIANKVFKAVVWQVVIADLVFVVYCFANDWHLTGGAMNAWLGATVVQVIAVAIVIARSLFPNRDRAVQGLDGSSPGQPA